MRSVDFDLYLVTDRKTTGDRDLMWVLEQALEGGVRAVQLREKDLPGGPLLELAVSLRDAIAALVMSPLPATATTAAAVLAVTS